MQNLKNSHKLLQDIGISNIGILKRVRLHSQDSLECKWKFNVGVMLKIDIVMAVTT